MQVLLKVASLCGLAVSLAACLLTESYRSTLESWVGSPEGRLVASWGPPDQVYELTDGSRVLSWIDGKTAYYGTAQAYPPPQSPPIYSSDGPVFIYDNPGERAYRDTVLFNRATNYCVTNFTIGANGLVNTWSYNGTDC